jgi:hypothetical protein
MTEKLHYQTQRPLDEVPAYATGLQLQSPRVYIALSATELVLYFESDLAVHYDLEGRLVKVADTGQFWRRSLSGRVLHSRKENGGLVRVVLPAAAANQIIVDAHQRVAAVRDGLGTVEEGKPTAAEALERIRPVLELAGGFDVPVAERDAEQFRAIYGRVAVLPPDQYNAFVVQATEGCAYNGCTFCELYKGVGYRRKSVEEFRQHLRAALNFHGESLRARRSIFLGEANALTQPTSMLKDIFRVIGENVELPVPEAPSAGISASWWLGSKTRFDGVSSFMDAFTNVNRTMTEYHDLRRAGLRRVYIGLETGHAGLLEWLKKPATPEAVVRCVRLLKECDILVGVIVLVGVGGRENASEHIAETVRVLNDLPLGRNDFVYFSPLIVYPGSQYDTQAMSDAVTPLTLAEMQQQENQLRAALRFDAQRGKPHLAHYELETFVY